MQLLMLGITAMPLPEVIIAPQLILEMKVFLLVPVIIVQQPILVIKVLLLALVIKVLPLIQAMIALAKTQVKMV